MFFQLYWQLIKPNVTIESPPYNALLPIIFVVVHKFSFAIYVIT